MPPLLSEPPATGLAAGGWGLHSPGHCLMGRASFSRHAPKDKIPLPFLGLAWSLLSLPPAKGEAESGPGGFCLILSLTLEENRWINKSLYSGFFVFVYLGVSYNLCFYDSFGIEGCWWVWFTPPQLLTRKDKCDLVTSRGQGCDQWQQGWPPVSLSTYQS